MLYELCILFSEFRRVRGRDQKCKTGLHPKQNAVGVRATKVGRKHLQSQRHLRKRPAPELQQIISHENLLGRRSAKAATKEAEAAKVAAKVTAKVTAMAVRRYMTWSRMRG